MNACPTCKGRGYVIVTLADGDVDRDICPACEPTACDGCGLDFQRHTLKEWDGELWCVGCFGEMQREAERQRDEDDDNFNRIIAGGLGL